MGFREHGVMLYLDKTLYLSFIKLQADQELGRSFAGLLPFVEGLYTMGYLDKKDYVEHRKKYSQKLVDAVPVEAPKCGFCNKPSVTRFKDKVSGFEKFACDYHAGVLQDAEKWVRVEVSR